MVTSPIGNTGLSEIECLERLFYWGSRRGDSRSLAVAAIETYGSLAKVLSRPGKELRETLGLSHALTSLLTIAKSSMKYVIVADPLPDGKQSSSATLVDYLSLELREAEQEIFRVLFLNAEGRVTHDEEMSRGTVDSVSVYPREVARKAQAHSASSVVLAHNHLSDDPTPSQCDIESTRRIKDALWVCDVALRDHVIIARSHCFSMKKKGLI